MSGSSPDPERRCSSSRLLCAARAGYEGEHCQVDVDECVQRPCENGGECFQRSDVLIYGMLPQLNATSFSYEAAAGFICSCLPGFTGKQREKNGSKLCLDQETDEELVSQETAAPSTWTSVRLLLVKTEEAARISSTLISVCVQMDSQVGNLSSNTLYAWIGASILAFFGLSPSCL